MNAMNTTDTPDTTAPKKTLPTHEVFDVQERPGQRSYWNKVGAAFVNKDGSHSVLLYVPGVAAPKRLQLRSIDRSVRPLKDGADPKKSPTHELFVVTESDGARNDWKRVGVGFTNKDGSLSLIVDNGVREGPKARFQMRARREVPKAEPTTAATPTDAPENGTKRTILRKRQAA